MQKILITGGTGLIGKNIINYFSEIFDIYVLTRQNKENVTSIKYINNLDEVEFDYSAIINLAGEPINQRWNERTMQEIYNSRITITKKLIEKIASINQSARPKVLISGSAIGYYPTGVNIEYNEDYEADRGSDMSFASKLCQDWEEAALEATKYGVRVCLLRTGVVLAKNAGMLGEVAPLVKKFLGAYFASGQQYISWVHIDDLVNIISKLIKTESLYGPVNATAPKPVTNYEFMHELGDVLYRPVFLKVPEFLAKFIYGQMAEELLLSGQYVKPAKLQKAGFRFKYRELDDALKSIYGSDSK